MGVSAGGYAAILFGSLCSVTNVIAFIPRTNLVNPLNMEYKNLRYVINPITKYQLYGNLSCRDTNGHHHISQCRNLKGFDNVMIIEMKYVLMKKLRDNGTIKKVLDEILFNDVV